ncbi:hypothetical protein POF50_007205 [Streptomyces sp. SL13]|uniref:Lipoprotein n=1 Tax=Streptantibioticus silvisoli TaxID=2705255 RepID=A0AA90KFN8_9ACTN|nr:hypothetical protein [Streptantibioticus silvisoli]MDI5969134.1 hypothetical protein [Streptantibioticus silvisoli]
MIRSSLLLIGAVLLAGCTVVHPAPARHVAPPAGSVRAAPPESAPPESAPPSATPSLVMTGPAPGPRPSAHRNPPPAVRHVTRRQVAIRPARHPRSRPRDAVRRAAPVPANAAALCGQGVRTRRIPASWDAICRAALGG